ncbi:MAG TPA: hypothetical protein VLI04_09060 [Nocardioidaceae bacterium]|nr:hypothetical protein [Nocardioidaceae bacterium]
MPSRRLLNLCALGGPAALLVTCVGWLVAGILPLPPGPSDSSEQVLSFFVDDSSRVLLGFVLSSIGVALIAPQFAVISMHMRRMEGGFPALAYAQLIVGAVTVCINLFPQLIWAVAAFRGDRAASEVVLLNDLAWLLLFTGITPFIIQNVAIAVCTLRARDRAVWPRWVAYLNLWVAAAFLPDPLAFFFKTGPFAWNGVLVFWLALSAYGVFLVVMAVVMVRANASLADDGSREDLLLEDVEDRVEVLAGDGGVQ